MVHKLKELGLLGVGATRKAGFSLKAIAIKRRLVDGYWSNAYGRKAGLTQDELREETAGGKVRKHRGLQ